MTVYYYWMSHNATILSCDSCRTRCGEEGAETVHTYIHTYIQTRLIKSVILSLRRAIVATPTSCQEYVIPNENYVHHLHQSTKPRKQREREMLGETHVEMRRKKKHRGVKSAFHSST
jgi:hypothetical protein